MLHVNLISIRSELSLLLAIANDLFMNPLNRNKMNNPSHANFDKRYCYFLRQTVDLVRVNDSWAYMWCRCFQTSFQVKSVECAIKMGIIIEISA